jgi:hypothetical protein
LTTIRSILFQVGQLSKKTSSDIATQVKGTMKELDTAACDISKLAGIKWKSLFVGGESTAGTALLKPSTSLFDFWV